MGTEALWVPLLLAAASTGVNYYNDKQLQSKQDHVISQGLQKQKQHQGDINKSTEELLSKFAASNPSGDQAKAKAQYTQQLGKNKGMANSGLMNLTGASSEYGAGSQDAALGIADYGDILGSLMSRIDAPESQRRREGVMTDDYAIGTDMVRRKSQGDQRLNDMKLAALKKNPWLSALSAGLAGAASAQASGGDLFGSLFGGKGAGFGVPGMLPVPAQGIGVLPEFDHPLWKF